jgi:hypothetical protein
LDGYTEEGDTMTRYDTVVLSRWTEPLAFLLLGVFNAPFFAYLLFGWKIFPEWLADVCGFLGLVTLVVIIMLPMMERRAKNRQGGRNKVAQLGNDGAKEEETGGR